MAHVVGKDSLIVDAGDGRLVATLIDSFAIAAGAGPQADWVILRLHHKDWSNEGPLVAPNRLLQVAIPSAVATQIGHSLLAYAAQAEKAATDPRTQ